MINLHVHDRDWEQDYRETIKHALSVADRIGSSAIFVMPNTKPAIISRELVERRLDDAREAQKELGTDVFYGVYIGLTANPGQVREAVRTYRYFFPCGFRNAEAGTIGMKLYAGPSTGNLEVTLEEDQAKIYETLASEGYRGVISVHCEDVDYFRPDLWDPERPWTHGLVRPKESEIYEVKRQIRLARKARFPGHLHITHSSVPKTIELVLQAKEKGMSISCGVTPHHCILSVEDMKEDRDLGLIRKVNPPLRSEEDRREMWQYLIDGKIDVIGTDHAPHTLGEKNGRDSYNSGFPGLPFLPHFLNRLREECVSEEQIFGLTHTNIEDVFGIKFKRRDVEPQLDLHEEYEIDAYLGFR